MTETLMRVAAVMKATGYSRSSLYALMQAGKFPRPVKLAGGGAVAWRSSEVQRWIDAQLPTQRKVEVSA
jgi:prophage regulatory protein